MIIQYCAQCGKKNETSAIWNDNTCPEHLRKWKNTVLIDEINDILDNRVDMYLGTVTIHADLLRRILKELQK